MPEPAIDSDVTFVARVINAPPMDRALPSSGCILLPATVGNLLTNFGWQPGRSRRPAAPVARTAKRISLGVAERQHDRWKHHMP
jgi:hypothetical protein